MNDKVNPIVGKQIADTKYFVTKEGYIYNGERPNESRNLSSIKGYRKINIKNKTLFVHRIVAEYFVDNPHGYNIVDHMDGNTSNNHVSNLQWCASLQNAQNRKTKESRAIYKSRHRVKILDDAKW